MYGKVNMVNIIKLQHKYQEKYQIDKLEYELNREKNRYHSRIR